MWAAVLVKMFRESMQLIGCGTQSHGGVLAHLGDDAVIEKSDDPADILFDVIAERAEMLVEFASHILESAAGRFRHR